MTKHETDYSKQLNDYAIYADDDLINFFNEIITVGSETAPRWSFNANTSTQIVILQLIRVLKEAFGRGFIVKE